MTEYEQQAKDFLEATGSKLECRFLGLKTGHFGPDDKMRDVWEILLRKGSRTYTFDFGNSIDATGKRLHWLAETELCIDMQYEPARKDSDTAYRILAGKTENYKKLRVITKWEEKAKEWHPVLPNLVGNNHAPTAYSILTSIGYEPPESVDDVWAEYGIEKPSEAIRVFEKMQKEWGKLRTLYNDEELTKLQEIN